jgi:hypothetical protein
LVDIPHSHLAISSTTRGEDRGMRREFDGSDGAIVTFQSGSNGKWTVGTLSSAEQCEGRERDGERGAAYEMIRIDLSLDPLARYRPSLDQSTA